MFVADGLHVPPIAYKLHSLSDLPSLILQVARTPTHGVLVSVSAVVYTRIFVSVRVRIVRSLGETRGSQPTNRVVFAGRMRAPIHQF